MTKYFALAFSALLVVIDQLIKTWAVRLLVPVRSIDILKGFFYLTYVENRGAAFGILQGRTAFLSVMVAAVLLTAVFLLVSGKIRGNFLIFTVALIIAGGAGNLIDRLTRGYVVDYLDFSPLFNFPVFNFADCCVVIGTFLLLGYVVKTDVIEKKRNSSESEKT